MADALDLLDDAQRVVFANPPHGSVAEYKIVDGLILRIYSRCRSLFAAAAILVRSEHAEEALILGRSLFTDSLRLMDLASQTDRAPLMLGFVTQSLADKRDMIRSAVRIGLDGDPTPLFAAMDEEERKLQRLQQRLGVAKVRRFGSERALATRHGRGEEYWTFEFGHRMTHGTTVAHETRTKKVAGTDAIGLHLRSSDPKYTTATTAFLVATMIDAQRAAASIFGWEEVAELQALWDRAQTMGHPDAT